MTDASGTDKSSLNAYWSRAAADLLTALSGTPAGLSAAEARARLERGGPNALKPFHRDSALRLFLAQFTNPLVLILIFAAVVSAIAGEWTDAVIVVPVNGRRERSNLLFLGIISRLLRLPRLG
jgi:magnesium-transporting ATPase (P-type)